MPYSNIDSPKKYFEAKTYTGTGATQSISGLEFSPDLVWIKNRSGANSHGLVSSLVNTRYALDTSATSGEVDFSTSGVTSLNSDGFTVVSHPVFNGSGNNYISWNWRGSDSSAVSNTAGTISSTVSANTTSGFSIVSYTGNATAGATVGHGLGVVPKMIILKRRTGSAEDWYVYHGSLANTEVLRLNLTNAKATRADFNNTTPTSSVFTVNSTDNVNASGSPFIAYCFAEVKGYSKFGSYTGNGSADGTFVYTGFKPAFFLIKNTTSGTSQWLMSDNKRNTSNVVNKYLIPNLSDAEASLDYVDFLSNGFKLKFAGGLSINQSGDTYIYMAFAENPFCSSKGIPTTAR